MNARRLITGLARIGRPESTGRATASPKLIVPKLIAPKLIVPDPANAAELGLHGRICLKKPSSAA